MKYLNFLFLSQSIRAILFGSSQYKTHNYRHFDLRLKSLKVFFQKGFIFIYNRALDLMSIDMLFLKYKYYNLQN